MLSQNKIILNSNTVKSKKMERLGIELFNSGTNRFHAEETVDLYDSTFMDYIMDTKVKPREKNVILHDYKQTREFCLFLRNFFIENDMFDTYISKNPHKVRFNNNDDIFCHIRLGDTLGFYDHSKIFDYYDKILSTTKFENGYIASDTIQHPICQMLLKKYNLQPYNSDDIDTIHFASTCKNLALSSGTYSWLMGFLGSYPGSISQIYYPKILKMWHGDILFMMIGQWFQLIDHFVKYIKIFMYIL